MQQVYSMNLHEALEKRYPLPKYTLVFEAPSSTGFNDRRFCDAIAIGCWKMVGVQIIGHEIKKSRADWLKEKDEPEKAEAWKQYCHLWYVVAPKGIVKMEELPPSWGLLEQRGTGLRVSKVAEKNSPLPMPVSVVAALVRKSQSCSDIEQVKRSFHHQGYQKGRLDAEASFKRKENSFEKRLKDLQIEHDQLRKIVYEFEAATGVSLVQRSWSLNKNLKDASRVYQEINQLAKRGLDMQKDVEAFARMLAIFNSQVAEGLEDVQSV